MGWKRGFRGRFKFQVVMCNRPLNGQSTSENVGLLIDNEKFCLID